MPSLQLPHTSGCIVCGPQNAHGLHLSLFVDTETNLVKTEFTPEAPTIGFQGIVHGGVIATVLDEAMVWAATWIGRRFCLCAELITRYRYPLNVGQTVIAEAKVDFHAPRLIQTSAKLSDTSGQLLSTASAKYIPLTPHESETFLATLLDHPDTTEAANILRGKKPAPSSR